MSKLTEHGSNIAMQIQYPDAFGGNGDLTLADVWEIIDNLHTHFLDTDRDTSMFVGWLRELESIDNDLPL